MSSSALPPLRLRDDRLWSLRIVRLFLLTFGVLAAWIFTYGFFDRKIHTTTGRAAWIWVEHDLPSREPVAFAAVREFTPPASRRYAWLSVAAHPEYSVSLNGRLVGTGASGRRPTLDRYEIGPLLREGKNRLVIRARSKDGVGGVLASIDYAPNLRNEEATPEGWVLTRNLAALSSGAKAEWEEPVVIGRPPVGPWNVPVIREREIMSEAETILAPLRIASRTLTTPEIAVLSGVAVIRERQEPARVFDFGREMAGRLRFTREADADSSVVRWKTTLEPADIAQAVHPEAAVFASGEVAYETPAERAFRYVVIYDEHVRVSAVRRDPASLQRPAQL